MTKTVVALNRRDTTLKVLVLVNNEKLSFSGSALSNFISVGYDTLRDIDDGFIFNYYWRKQNGGSTPFDTKISPLDINSSSNKTINTIGVKIIFDSDYRQGVPDWNELFTLIIYAVNNVETVRRCQTRNTVRYNTNGWYVSIMTLDANKINVALKMGKTSMNVIPTSAPKGFELVFRYYRS